MLSKIIKHKKKKNLSEDNGSQLPEFLTFCWICETHPYVELEAFV